MKDLWYICKNCVYNGHCQNQNMGIKCETYPKSLEDKISKAIALIKDGRFVEALQLLEGK